MTGLVGGAWDNAAALFPSAIVLDVLPEIDVIEDTTGTILRTLTGGNDGSSGGTDPSFAPPAIAICVTYQTGGVVNGKHVRGRSFLSPLWFGDMESDGTITSAALNLAEGWADDWQGPGTSVRSVIWSRPVKSKTEPGEYVRFGSSHDITSSAVLDKFAVLRSRRD
jgi:hypothetical protein